MITYVYFYPFINNSLDVKRFFRNFYVAYYRHTMESRKGTADYYNLFLYISIVTIIIHFS